jgi:AraC family L-rhamnose operon transcriptional activator RhaR
MLDPPVENNRERLRFIPGEVAFAGHYLHENVHPAHTHSFVEIAVHTGGAGVHHSLAGRQRLAVGDVVLLRPGVWHGYEECRRLDMYNCCFSADLLQRELAWTREDPLLGHLLWTGPYAEQRRGVLSTRLEPDVLAECLVHLDALERLRLLPVALHRSDIVGRLTLFLGHLARAAAYGTAELGDPTHPAVMDAMRMMESRPAHPWTLTELAASRRPGCRRSPTCPSTGSSWPPPGCCTRTTRSAGSASRSAGRTRTTSPAGSRRTTG